jgi:epoxyqueuosine reductase
MRDVHKRDIPPYKVDAEHYHRFDQRKTVFGRMLHDPQASFYRRSMYSNCDAILAEHRDGCSRIDLARVLASWTVHDYFHGAFSHDKLTNANNVMNIPELPQYVIDDPAVMSIDVKNTARFFGAAAAGIGRLDHRWVYAHDMDGASVVIPEGFAYTVVMTIPMDPHAIRTSPGFSASYETGQGYSRMAYCVACVAEFIRSLGYHALPMGNDTALSIPLAIDAGLGELGRLGLLITPEHGPCVRLCKIFTDIPLVPDRPITFGVREFCSQCTRCADACHAEAISRAPQPLFNVVCPSNNAGIERWAVDHDQCYNFWIENGSDCSNCIAACPYTPCNEE